MAPLLLATCLCAFLPCIFTLPEFLSPLYVVAASLFSATCLRAPPRPRLSTLPLTPLCPPPPYLQRHFSSRLHASVHPFALAAAVALPPAISANVLRHGTMGCVGWGGGGAMTYVWGTGLHEGHRSLPPVAVAPVSQTRHSAECVGVWHVEQCGKSEGGGAGCALKCLPLSRSAYSSYPFLFPPLPSLPPSLPSTLQATLQRASGGLTQSDCTQFAYGMTTSLPAGLADFSCSSSGIPGPTVTASALLAGPSAAQVCDIHTHVCGEGTESRY